MEGFSHDLLQWGILLVGAIAAGAAWIGARRTRLKNVKEEHQKAIQENTKITEWRTKLESRVEKVETHAGEDGKVLEAIEKLRNDMDNSFDESRTRESEKNEKLHDKIDKLSRSVSHLEGKLEGRSETLNAVREVMKEEQNSNKRGT